MAERIAHVRVDDPESGAAIHQAMATLSIPPDLERAIVQACKHLHNSAVAVRSSATVEDLADAAFAGQQDTFLNIGGARCGSPLLGVAVDRPCHRVSGARRY